MNTSQPVTQGPQNRPNDIDEKISCGRFPKTVTTLSDSVEFGMTSEDGVTRFCRGFHVNIDGTLYIQAPDSNGEVVKLKVKEGNYYPYSVRYFRSTGSDAGLAGEIVAWR